MDNGWSEKISSVWALATGRPLPFLPPPAGIPEDFPIYFPVVGLVVGCLCAVTSWLVLWLFGTLAGAVVSGILIALMLEIITAWRGFNGGALFLMRLFPKTEEAASDNFIAQPMFFGAILFAVRAVMIAAIGQAGGAYWLIAVLLCAYFAREELSAAITPGGGELIRTTSRERMRGGVTGCMLIFLFMIATRRILGPAAMFLLTWLISWYLVRRTENETLPFDRKTFDTTAYLIETVLLILTVIFIHR